MSRSSLQSAEPGLVGRATPRRPSDVLKMGALRRVEDRGILPGRPRGYGERANFAKVSLVKQSDRRPAPWLLSATRVRAEKAGLLQPVSASPRLPLGLHSEGPTRRRQANALDRNTPRVKTARSPPAAGGKFSPSRTGRRVPLPFSTRLALGVLAWSR